MYQDGQLLQKVRKKHRDRQPLTINIVGCIDLWWLYVLSMLILGSYMIGGVIYDTGVIYDIVCHVCTDVSYTTRVSYIAKPPGLSYLSSYGHGLKTVTGTATGGTPLANPLIFLIPLLNRTPTVSYKVYRYV